MDLFPLFVITGIYTIVLLIVLWVSDVEKMEALLKLLTAFALGFAAIVIAAGIESTFALFISASSVFMIVVVAPIVEEIAKIDMATRSFYKDMDEPEDSLIYGGIVALGFGFLENILYILKYSMELTYLQLADLTIARMLYSIPAHITATIMGTATYWYLRKVNNLDELEAFVISVIPAAILHATYNIIALTGDLLLLTVIAAIYVTSIVITWYLLRELKPLFHFATKI
jgi:RsiW-degrading membrane proteinase PrsW (M82 family)